MYCLITYFSELKTYGAMCLCLSVLLNYIIYTFNAVQYYRAITSHTVDEIFFACVFIANFDTKCNICEAQHKSE